MDLYEIRRLLANGLSVFDIEMNVTFYARVSTNSDDQFHSLTNQIEYFKSLISKNSKWTYVGGYTDEGISGTSVKKRLEFLRMIDDARKNKFDFIITKEISRFSRNTLDSIKYTQDLLKYGVGVLFQSDNINTLSPDAELRLTIMSSIAQDEVRKISERVKFGFRRAIENGVVLGNNNIWGYKKEEGKLVIVEEEAEIVKDIFSMYVLENVGIRTICNRLSKKNITNSNGNAFSFSTVRGILCNPKYKGFYCGNKTHKFDYKLSAIKYLEPSEWVTYKDELSVPAIISEELWGKANEILTNRSEKMALQDKTSYQNKFAYSGLVFCGEHNLPYYHKIYKYVGSDKEAWQCKLYNDGGKVMCNTPIVYKDELDTLMKQIFCTAFACTEKIVCKLIKIYEEVSLKANQIIDTSKIDKEIVTLQNMKDKLLLLCVNGNLENDEFEERNNEFNRKIVHLKDKVIKNNVALEESAMINLNEISYEIRKELCFEEGINSEIVVTLIDKIVVLKSGETNKINLTINIIGSKTVINGMIERKRKKTSVCTIQYI